MPNTMPDMVSRPAVVKKSLLGCEWSRKVQKLKTTKFQNQAVPKPGGAARGGDNKTSQFASAGLCDRKLDESDESPDRDRQDSASVSIRWLYKRIRIQVHLLPKDNRGL